MIEFVQLSAAGVALGARYALVALGFVIVFRATGVLNFAQGGLLAVGAYFAYSLNTVVPFAVAVVLALVGTGLLGALIERVVLRRMVGQPVFSVIMITIGLMIVLEQAVTSIWGYEARSLGDPWGASTVDLGEIVLAARDLWSVGVVAVALLALFAFFNYTRLGLGMRAAALDAESALAQGITPVRVQGAAWALAGIVGALGGIMLAAGPSGVEPTIGEIALLAFPAIILGGLDSPVGAVVGGLLIGLVQAWTAGYQSDIAPWLGPNMSQIAPYVVMVLILLVRPHGLFGTREVRRI